MLHVWKLRPKYTLYTLGYCNSWAQRKYRLISFLWPNLRQYHYAAHIVWIGGKINELKKIWKKYATVWSLEWLKETAEGLDQDDRYFDWHFNWMSQEHNSIIYSIWLKENSDLHAESWNRIRGLSRLTQYDVMSELFQKPQYCMPPDDGRMTETCCGSNVGRGEEELLRWRTINCFVNFEPSRTRKNSEKTHGMKCSVHPDNSFGVRDGQSGKRGNWHGTRRVGKPCLGLGT
jgi:hypothetical protein